VIFVNFRVLGNLSDASSQPKISPFLDLPKPFKNLPTALQVSRNLTEITRLRGHIWSVATQNLQDRRKPRWRRNHGTLRPPKTFQKPPDSSRKVCWNLTKITRPRGRIWSIATQTSTNLRELCWRRNHGTLYYLFKPCEVFLSCWKTPQNHGKNPQIGGFKTKNRGSPNHTKIT
jgi:hypothetical protein